METIDPHEIRCKAISECIGVTRRMAQQFRNTKRYEKAVGCDDVIYQLVDLLERERVERARAEYKETGGVPFKE